jgi:hypothetical protein
MMSCNRLDTTLSSVKYRRLRIEIVSKCTQGYKKVKGSLQAALECPIYIEDGLKGSVTSENHLKMLPEFFPIFRCKWLWPLCPFSAFSSHSTQIT